MNKTRDELFGRGIIFDINVTQFLNANFEGGRTTNIGRYNCSSDYFLAWDSGKAGAWSGGPIILHGESSWQAAKSINPDVSSLLPTNFDATMPEPLRKNAFRVLYRINLTKRVSYFSK